MAEDAARELPNLPLEGALQLVHLYAERGSPKYERAAMRWLERYLSEHEPRGEDVVRRRVWTRAPELFIAINLAEWLQRPTAAERTRRCSGRPQARP